MGVLTSFCLPNCRFRTKFGRGVCLILFQLGRPRIMDYYMRQLPDHCTSFISDAGKALFKQAMNQGHMECFFKLAAQLRTQDQIKFCGTATLVTVLNALEVDSRLEWKPQFTWYHEEMLDNCIPTTEIAEKGIVYDHFVMLAVCNNLEVCLRVRPGNTAAEKLAFKQLVMEVTRRDDHVLVLNYSRAAVGQLGIGHFAPVGGYNTVADQILVFDVARFKYPSHWISFELLWEAMKVTDLVTGLPRGYILLKKNKISSYLTFQIDRNLLDALFPPTGTNTALTRAMRTWWTQWMTWLESPESQLAVLHAAVEELLKESAISLFLCTKVFFVVIRERTYRGNNITQSLIQGLDASPIGRTIRAALKEKRKTSFEDENYTWDSLMHRENVSNVVDPTAAHITAFLLGFPYEPLEGTWSRALWEIRNTELAQLSGVTKTELTHLTEILKVLLTYWKVDNEREVSI